MSGPGCVKAAHAVIHSDPQKKGHARQWPAIVFIAAICSGVVSF
jgi:hypothetical protein